MRFAAQALIAKAAGLGRLHIALEGRRTQNLQGTKLSPGSPGDAIGEGAAYIDRETPAWGCLAHQETKSNPPTARSAISIRWRSRAQASQPPPSQAPSSSGVGSSPQLNAGGGSGSSPLKR